MRCGVVWSGVGDKWSRPGVLAVVAVMVVVAVEHDMGAWRDVEWRDVMWCGGSDSDNGSGSDSGLGVLGTRYHA